MTKRKKATTRTGNLVYIKWLDHCAWETTRWHEVDETKRLTPIPVETVGWVIKETKKHIIVASIVTDGGHTNGEMCIIKGCIVKRKNLNG